MYEIDMGAQVPAHNQWWFDSDSEEELCDNRRGSATSVVFCGNSAISENVDSVEPAAAAEPIVVAMAKPGSVHLERQTSCLSDCSTGAEGSDDEVATAVVSIFSVERCAVDDLWANDAEAEDDMTCAPCLDGAALSIGSDAHHAGGVCNISWY